MGAVVIGGMLTATLFAVFMVPVFFVIVHRFFPSHARTASAPTHRIRPERKSATIPAITR